MWAIEKEKEKVGEDRVWKVFPSNLLGDQIFNVRGIFIFAHSKVDLHTVEIHSSSLCSALLQTASYVRETPHSLSQLLHSVGRGTHSEITSGLLDTVVTMRCRETAENIS